MQPASTLSFRLHALVYSIDKLGSAVLKQHTSVSFPQFLVILCAHQNPGHTQKFAAEWLQLTEATVSYLVKRLVQTDYLAIKQDAADGRTKRVYATEKGHTLISKIYPLLEKALEPHVRKLSSDELAGMQKSISTIFESIKEFNEKNR